MILTSVNSKDSLAQEQKFLGKKLLLLGSNAGSKDIITYAKSHGAYVIVTDNLSVADSFAKSLADEAWDVSTADLDILEGRIRTRSIDGVFAGVSEFNLISAIELSERVGLRFYCSRAQWDAISLKDQFRALCIENKVPHPELFYVGTSIDEIRFGEITFPVVLKPVDASASAGVRICSNSSELRANFAGSRDESPTGRVLIEEFVDGVEFTAHYSIKDGKAALCSIDNRYPIAVNDGRVTTIPVARLYPSLFLDSYLQVVNDSLLEMCEGLGARNGVLFVQGLFDSSRNEFFVFEGGFRSAAELPYRFLELVNGVNYLHLLIDEILAGESSYDQSREDPALGGSCCGVVSFVATGGTVGSIVGLETTVSKMESVIDYEVRYPVGTAVPAGDTLRQLMIRFVLVCHSRDEMAESINFLNQNVSVRSTTGENMVLKMDPDRAYGWL